MDQEEFQGKMHATLNEKGDHFPHLGSTQEEFYKYCKTLDSNNKIQKPIVAIFGGAYGKRAIEVLQQTRRVTVILNDLEEGHFVKIKQWCKDNLLFAKRLKLVPGSFLDIHKNKCVQDFFQSCPIKFHAILMANVFHYLHPLEGIKGLHYTADHLVDGGEAFLMTSQTRALSHDEYDESQAANVLRMLNEQFALGLGQQYLEEALKITGASFEETYTNYVQKVQCNLLYRFNKDKGIVFPGHYSIEEGTLNPLFLKLSHFSFGDPQGKSFFTSTPEDMKRWSETVGLECQGIKYFNINSNEATVIIPVEANSEVARYYFMRLKKSLSPHEDKYQELLKQAQCIDNKLKDLHAGKIFALASDPPHFEIMDLKTQERFPVIHGKLSMEDEKQINDLSERMFKGEISVIVPLGLLYKKYEFYDLARYLFQFADDMGIKEGTIELGLL
jgi:hypothetical protein